MVLKSDFKLRSNFIHTPLCLFVVSRSLVLCVFCFVCPHNMHLAPQFLINFFVVVFIVEPCPDREGKIFCVGIGFNNKIFSQMIEDLVIEFFLKRGPRID